MRVLRQAEPGDRDVESIVVARRRQAEWVDDNQSLDAALREFARERAVAARDVEHGAIDVVVVQQHLAERDVRKQRVDEELDVLRVATPDVVHRVRRKLFDSAAGMLANLGRRAGAS